MHWPSVPGYSISVAQENDEAVIGEMLPPLRDRGQSAQGTRARLESEPSLLEPRRNYGTTDRDGIPYPPRHTGRVLKVSASHAHILAQRRFHDGAVRHNRRRSVS